MSAFTRRFIDLRSALLPLLLLLAASVPAHADCGADAEDLDAVAAVIAVHAFQGHSNEFWFDSAPALAAHIASIMKNPSDSKALARDRVAYWDEDSSTIVIYDARSAHCGSAFRPSDGKEYYVRQT